MKHPPPPIPKTAKSQAQRPSVQFDWQDWLPYLADADIPEDQQQEWIETLWSIVLGFVDLGFDVKSPSETCGEALDLKAALEAAVLRSDHANTQMSGELAQREDAYE